MTDTANEPRIWKWMSILSAVVIGLCFVYLLIISHYVPDLLERGQFGDTFGALNALFAGCAFGGLIIALILQRLEIKQQWKELELTRNEIAGQTRQLGAQARSLAKQNFENSFFQLLRSHIAIVDSLQTADSAHRIGRQCFGTYISRLKTKYESESNRDINEIWREFAENDLRGADHYFRHLYNTIKFVDEHSFLQDFEEKKHYTDLIRGHLSSNEQGVVFYNCLSDRGAKFKRLVEKYSLFEVMDYKVLLDERHLDLYKKRAFETFEGP